MSDKPQPSRVMEDAVRQAEHFCPTNLPHLDKLRWKADYIERAIFALEPTPTLPFVEAKRVISDMPASELRGLAIAQFIQLQLHAKYAQQATLESSAGAGSEPESNRQVAAPDPMTMPLPCDVKVGQTTFRKGVPLRTPVLHANRIRDELHKRWSSALGQATGGAPR